jgi:hypothetical protein
MHEVDAARRLLRRLIDELRRRGSAPPEPVVACALLASRLGHREMASSLTRLALRGRPLPDYRVVWLLHRLSEECSTGNSEDVATWNPSDIAAIEALRLWYQEFLRIGDIDPINGATGVGLALWDLADSGARAELRPSLEKCAVDVLRWRKYGLYHGRSGGILVLRMLGRAPGRDPDLTMAVDALLEEIERLRPAALDTGQLGRGGIALCTGLPGFLTALGTDTDPGALERVTAAVITEASLERLDRLAGDDDADTTLCHGLAGAVLATRLSACWHDLVGTDRAIRLTTRLAEHLDRAGDEAVEATFDGPFMLSVLEGPLGVALALAETATASPPWWGIGMTLGDGTPAVAGGRAIEANAMMSPGPQKSPAGRPAAERGAAT